MEGLLTVKDASKVLKASQSHIYGLAERGILPCVRWQGLETGKRKKTMVRFRLEDVQAFIEVHRKG